MAGSPLDDVPKSDIVTQDKVPEGRIDNEAERSSGTPFKIISDKSPKGDQPYAIDSLSRIFATDGSNQRERATLLGVTGSGKTFTVANLIQNVQRPTLVIAHNKTLAAQLYSEFSDIFPNNAVRYFVSYYDYYQPEAYVPSSDTYIEKDSSINDEIDKMRHATTTALLERRDVLVVSSVSCIYGLGDPKSYFDMMLSLRCGAVIDRRELLNKLVFLQYKRSDEDFCTGTFRVRGDVIEVCTADQSESAYRIELFGNEVERITQIDRLTGSAQRELPQVCVYPGSHFVTGKETIERAISTIRSELKSRVKVLESEGKMLEATRLSQRTRYDLELLKEMGFCPGIENYSRHFTGLAPGEPPPTLLDYFPRDFMVVVDESHVTVSQIGGMYRGDRARKQTLVDHGFRLPSALDNRPLRFDEFESRTPRVLYVSATPSQFEINDSRGQVIEQLLRPTGLVDPPVEIRPAAQQVDNFLHEVRSAVEKGNRALVTTLTKRMAEDLSEYYHDVGVKVKYLHSDIHTLDRIEIIKALRAGEFDLLVGINLLREGLDLPEVSLVGVMDADKEGFLRSQTSLIQTIGRAARNIDGHVILYADRETHSIKAAINETNRRREHQVKYNLEHNIVPKSVSRRQEADIVKNHLENIGDEATNVLGDISLPKDAVACKKLMNAIEKDMFAAAKEREFEKAAVFRDQYKALGKLLLCL